MTSELLSPWLFLTLSSSISSRDEMVQYMSEQQMPWVALSYGHKLVEKLRLDYKYTIIVSYNYIK